LGGLVVNRGAGREPDPKLNGCAVGERRGPRQEAPRPGGMPRLPRLIGAVWIGWFWRVQMASLSFVYIFVM